MSCRRRPRTRDRSSAFPSSAAAFDVGEGLNIDASGRANQVIHGIAEPAALPILTFGVTDENLGDAMGPCEIDNSLDRVFTFKHVKPSACLTRDFQVIVQ